MSTIEKSIDVEVPVSAAYNQWTQFEEFPQFMEGIEEVRQLDDKRLHWKASILGVTREWDAEIVDQKPDQQVAWRAVGGTKNDGVVMFFADPMNTGRTRLTMRLEFEPEGVVEKVGDVLHVVERRVQGDLERFKEFIEKRGTATGGWRGEIKPTGEVNRDNAGRGGLGGTTGGGALGSTHT
ncbi:MAG TPA: SRPBCC family protein [Mycobacteriales bacterium]|nr:SRPBCC family protein [Mycobacteriales bacterium]